MVAPNTIDGNVLLLKAVNLQRALSTLQTVDDLINLRIEYQNWRATAKDAVNNSKRIAMRKKLHFFQNDSVEFDLAQNGGVGVDLQSTRARQVVDILHQSLSRWIDFLSGIDFERKLVEKHEDGNFYFDGQPIIIGRTTAHYHLLDIMIALGNNANVVSYSDLIAQMEERLKNGGFGKQRKIKLVTMNTIENALAALFRHSTVEGKRLENETLDGHKFIEVRRGEGLILNNNISA